MFSCFGYALAGLTKQKNVLREVRELVRENQLKP